MLVSAAATLGLEVMIGSCIGCSALRIDCLVQKSAGRGPRQHVLPFHAVMLRRSLGDHVGANFVSYALED